MHVAYLVAHDDEGGFAALFGKGEDVVHGGVLGNGGDGDHALVRAGYAHLVELAPVHRDDGDAALLRAGYYAAQGAVTRAAGDEQLVDGPPGPHRLVYRVAALYQINPVIPALCVHDGLRTKHSDTDKTIPQRRERIKA